VTTLSVEILFADDHLIVVNKPSHLLSVAGIGPEKQDCVVRRMVEQFGGWVREVHRLDWETSGLLALARTPDAHRHLMKQFHDRLVDKSYTAIVAGVPRSEKGTISLPLCVDWPNRPKQKVDHQEGKPSITHWRRLVDLRDRCRMELIPVTGRSHQLRVHMESMGHPILGDQLYGTPHTRSLAERLQLHATTLDITHPASGERLQFRNEPPF